MAIQCTFMFSGNKFIFMLFAFMSFGKPPKIHGIRSKIPQYVIFSDFIGEKSKNGHKAVYVVSHFSGKRSKPLE